MRATNGAARHQMIKRLMKRAKGFWGGRHKMYRVACEAVKRAEQQSFIGRRLKKRQFRSLWIKRISIAAREHGITYSRLINALQRLDIRLDRKQLSELAILQPAAFAEVCAKAKAA
jgi:large subunit ribosomal protein L20